MTGKKHTGILLFAGAVVLTLTAAKPAVGLLPDMVSHWAAPLVGALEAKGIVSGDADFRFYPDRPLTRAQLAKLLTVGLGQSDDALLLASYGSRFTDVPKWHWANGYVESLAETGAVEGYPDGRFGPEDEVTRAQLSVIFVRAAGLADQARLMRFDHTDYADDAEIPAWARGFVHVARSAGLMAGFEDNTFRPNVPVTRAEGSTALFRLLSAKGRVYHLSGTLLRFDSVTRQGTVRDGGGREVDFTMSQGAGYIRSGLPGHVGQIRPLDQIWVTLGPDGIGTFLDARYTDRLVRGLAVSGRTVTGKVASGGIVSAGISRGTLLYHNGKPATLAQIDGASVGYLALDQVTGEARFLDALSVSDTGLFAGFDPGGTYLALEAQREIWTLPLAEQVTYVLNGVPVVSGALRLGDSLQVVTNEAGAVTYVLAER